MACINTSLPQYKKLLKEAEESWKSEVDLYLDVSSFNEYFDRLPNSLSELDKGIEFIKYKNLLSDKIADILMINSPSVTRNKDKINVYEFRVAEGSRLINTRDKVYKVAERLAEQVNNEFVGQNQKNIARVSDESGIVKVTIELNSPVINSYRETSYLKDAQDMAEYEEDVRNELRETTPEYNAYEDYQAYEDFNRLLESGEIKQFCKL